MATTVLSVVICEGLQHGGQYQSRVTRLQGMEEKRGASDFCGEVGSLFKV